MDIRQKILQADDLEERTINIPEWDVQVLVRAMTAEQRLSLVGLKDAEFQYNIIMLCVLDPKTGQAIFKKEDLPQLALKASKPINDLTNIALDLSGLGEDALEEAEKNLGAGS